MLKHANLSTFQIRKILLCFAKDMTATEAAQKILLNRKTINRYYQIFRVKIASLTGRNNIKHRNSTNIVNYVLPIFKIQIVDNRILIEEIDNPENKKHYELLLDFDELGSVLYSTSERNTLTLNNYKIVHFSAIDENLIDDFWNYSVKRLNKFRGLNLNNIYLHLKESEFRFNNKTQDIYKLMICILKEF